MNCVGEPQGWLTGHNVCAHVYESMSPCVPFAKAEKSFKNWGAARQETLENWGIARLPGIFRGCSDGRGHGGRGNR